MKAKGLGRGLGALLGDAEATIIENPKESLEIEVSRIDVCKSQPRKNFDEEKLNELAASIKRHGVIQPLILNKKGSRYQIIAGERRYRAARIAGLKTVPAIVKDMEAGEILQVSIIENIQRENLNPMEEAMAISMLMKEYGFTQEKVAEALGRSRSAVANTLRLLALPKSVAEMVEAGMLSAGHARTLIPLKDKKLLEAAAREVAEKEMSVRDTEEYVKKMLAPAKPVPAKPRKNPEFARAEKELSEAMETKIRLSGSRERGKLIIEYFSAEQLDGLYDFLMQAKK